MKKADMAAGPPLVLCSGFLHFSDQIAVGGVGVLADLHVVCRNVAFFECGCPGSCLPLRAHVLVPGLALVIRNVPGFELSRQSGVDVVVLLVCFHLSHADRPAAILLIDSIDELLGAFSLCEI